MKLSLVLEDFAVGEAFDGTLMMKMMDKSTNEESGDAIRAQFSRANMLPTTKAGHHHCLIPATIIGGYGSFKEAKGAVILDGKVKVDKDGNLLGVATFEIEGDIITEGIVDEWEQEGAHQESLRGGGGGGSD